MTVETTARKQNFAGGQGSLAFTFRALSSAPEDIKVVVVTSGTETLLDYTDDYTVSINSDGVGGTVTVSPSYGTEYTYTVYRETTNKQESDYEDFNQFPSDTLEEDLDRRTLISQEVDEDKDRSLKAPISSDLTDLELPAPAAGEALIWNAAEDALVNTGYDIADVENYATTCSTQAALAGNYATTCATIAAGIFKVVSLKVIEDTDALNTGNGQIYFTVTDTLDGLNLTGADAAIYTASATASSIQIGRGRRAGPTASTTVVDMLSTPITVDANEFDSKDAATPPVIDTSNDDVAEGDVLQVDVDTAGSGAAGLEVRLRFAS